MRPRDDQAVMAGFRGIRVQGCGEGTVDATWSTMGEPPYRSWGHSVYQVLSGSAEIELDGRWSTLRPGQVYVIPGHRLVRRRTTGMHHRWVNFQVDPLSLDLHLGRAARVLAWPIAGCRPWVAALKRVPDIADRSRDRDARSSVDAMRLDGLLVQAAAALLEAAGAMPPIAVDDALRRALVHLDRNYRDSPSLAAVAVAAARSPAHLQRSFAAAFGCSPARYALTRRMLDAQHLLTATTEPIAVCAERCGYADAFHFSRVFRRYFGLSPTQQRKARVR